MDRQTEVGRLFHSLGPETEKYWISKLWNPLELEAEHGVTMNAMYDGEVPEWIR